MKINSAMEFRKAEKRQSSKGNVFYMLKFEDDNGDALNLYAPINKEYTVEPATLARGNIVDLALNYKYNGYEKNWRMELVDILGQHEEE